MNSVSLFVVGVFLATSLVAGVAEAGDFVLSGNQHLNVTTAYANGVLYDSSTADVLAGGSIFHAYANDCSVLSVASGGVSYLDAYDTSAANISGGDVGYLNAYNTGVVNISGGNVSSIFAYNTSVANMSGGGVGDLGADGTGVVNASGGTVSRMIARYGGVANMSGGSVSNLVARFGGAANISGGSLGDLAAYETSSATFYGYDFRAFGGLSLDGQRVVGLTGILTGKWCDGTPWVTTISWHGSEAIMRVVPEPSSVLALLLAVGGAGAAAR
jgi:hypothetical protein